MLEESSDAIGESSVAFYVTVWTENRMEDVTEADDKSSRTKLVFSKVQGRT
jgi:hypothetical protein